MYLQPQLCLNGDQPIVAPAWHEIWTKYIKLRARGICGFDRKSKQNDPRQRLENRITPISGAPEQPGSDEEDEKGTDIALPYFSDETDEKQEILSCRSDEHQLDVHAMTTMEVVELVQTDMELAHQINAFLRKKETKQCGLDNAAKLRHAHRRRVFGSNSHHSAPNTAQTTALLKLNIHRF